jgi:hypothetical protein
MPTTRTFEIPQPWRDFLRDLDQQASETVSLHCFGGFVILQAEGERNVDRDDHFDRLSV